MRLIRITFRGIALTVLIVSGMILTVIFQRGQLRPRGFSSSLTCWWHRTFARLMGVRIRVQGEPRPEATLFISNHVSWFDITALGGLLKSHFLSKAEVREWPVVGFLATKSGTLYIKRGGLKASQEANRVMAEVLGKNHNVVLFPEGTTTAGHTRKFHSRLIQCAIDTGAHIQPIAIHYPRPASLPEALEHHIMHPDAMYIDDMTFGESILRMLGANNIETHIIFCEPVHAQGKTRDELARIAEEAVRNALELRVTRLGKG